MNSAQFIDRTTTKISKVKQVKQKIEAGFTKESVCNHLQLSIIQTTFSGREKLPAQHLSKLWPSGCRTVGKEHDVLEKQTHIKKHTSSNSQWLLRAQLKLKMLHDVC